MAGLTFDAKGRTLGRLPDAGEHIELHVSSEGLNQANGGGALSFSERGGSDAVSRGSSSPVRLNSCFNPALNFQNETQNLTLMLLKHCRHVWFKLGG